MAIPLVHVMGKKVTCSPAIIRVWQLIVLMKVMFHKRQSKVLCLSLFLEGVLEVVRPQQETFGLEAMHVLECHSN